MGPLELIYSWQALLLALMVCGITHTTKTLLDYFLGKEARKENVFVTRILLPSVAVVSGIVLAIVVPLRPEVLLNYADQYDLNWTRYLVYGSWGGACGQFCDYFYSKVKAFMASRSEGSGPNDMGPPRYR